MRLYSFYLRYVSPLRSNTVIFRWLFGFYPAKALWGQYWDWTTLALRSVLRRYLKPDMALLDMGCGPYAVLSRFAPRKLNCRSVTGADHCQELIDYARQTDPESGIAYVCSDLFDSISGRFALIVFNAPYIEADRGEQKGSFPTSLTRKRFCGGKEGVQTIARFLQDAPSYLQPGGKVLLGVNHYHIGREAVRSEIFRSGLRTVATLTNPLTKACVYVLMEKGNAEM